MGDDPIRRLWFASNPLLFNSMANDISAEVQRMAVTSIPLYFYMTLRGKDSPDWSEDGKRADVIPDSYIVETDEASLRAVFGKGGSPEKGGNWKWGDIKPSGEQVWISELATAMALYIHEKNTTRRIRSSFKANDKDYTPVLDEINRTTDEYSFHVLFLEQTWSDDDRRTEPVSSFRDLMERLVDLVKSTKDGDTISYLAYTPALGFLTEVEDQWEKLYGSMRDQADKMDMICLTKTDLVRWHGEFLGKKTARPKIETVDEGLIKEAGRVSDELLWYLVQAGRSPIQRLFAEMPGFYLFKNASRAIIVSPVGVPLLRQMDAAPVKKEMKESKVEMFGLDTTVPQILKNASLAFNGFRP